MLKKVFYIIIFLFFFWFEFELYKKYQQEERNRRYIKNQNTQRIENSFLIRERYFYLDKNYLENYKKLKSKEEKSVELEGGGEIIIE